MSRSYITRCRARRCFVAVCAVQLCIACGCGACCEHMPCLPGAEVGRSYSVEVVQHIGDAPIDGAPGPFSKYPGSMTSCGVGFDVELDDVVTFDVNAWWRPGGTNGFYCEECRSATATFEVSNVRKRKGPSGVDDLGSFDVFQAMQVSVGDGCYGNYWIGISHRYTRYLLDSGQAVASDFVLFRLFSIDDGSVCNGMDASVSECWDTWAVRIRDEAGHLVSRDVPIVDGSLPKFGDGG